MATVSIESIKKLREETGAGILDSRAALELNDGDMQKAKEYLRKKGLEKADKKADREIKSGLVYSYIHGVGKVGAMVEMGCETDFVAKTDDFVELCKEVSMQVASMSPESVEELMKQAYIRDPKKTVEDLVKEKIAKLGENIQIRRFVRYALGEQ